MKESLKELTEGMQRLCAIANRIVSHGDEVSRIERDLLLEDLRRLYDVALRLNVDSASVETPRTASQEERMEVRPVMPDDEMLSSTVMATMAAMAVPEPEPDTLLSQPQAASSPSLGEQQDGSVVVEEQQEVISPEEEDPREAVAEVSVIPEMETLEANGNGLLFDEVIIEPEPTVEPQHAAPLQTEQEVISAPESGEEDRHEEPQAAGTQASLLDYLKRPVEEKPTVRTLGEKLGGVESGERRVESGIDASKKVSDLRTVININDKFSFMSELFHNNMKAYNDFILRLNAIDNRDEALLCVNEVSVQYKWDESSLAVQSFYKVFDKKF